MHTLSIHLLAIKEKPGETKEERQKREDRVLANTKLLNMLLSSGFTEAFNVDPDKNTISHFREEKGNIVKLCEKTVWVIQDFEALPLDIIIKIDEIEWATYTLQKK